MLPCFCCTYECLEGETKPYTMSELETKMREILNSDNVFSKKYLKTNSSQAKKKSDFIYITQGKGVSNVIIFKDMTANIIKK